MADEKAPIIVIKKIIKGGGGHHGGAWKVAYADFVTAMMAFFLLMWLLNATTEEQRQGISEYFDPTPMEVSSSTSGAGGVMGGLTVSKVGSRVTDVQPIVHNENPPSPNVKMQIDPEQLEKEQLQQELQKREDAEFEQVKEKIEQAIQDSELKDLAKNLMVDMTPEGLRIQIVDQDGESMFPSGSARPYEKTVKLIKMVGDIIHKMPNQISVRGHTDSVPYTKGADYTNWELSADRANASRRVLLSSGIEAKKLSNVVGKADTEHLKPDLPKDPQNRRISIILLRESLTKPVTAAKAASGGTGSVPVDPGYRKTTGNVQFP
ncbi:MAG: flagellar motor protein MotB [Alphaproteobacteria bacterium]|nr:flagellar motor protein MotB [Alphaproteobacteria bacterium]MCB1550547.1 flagellar motor protein MotB [Alphaproteobacteria bacterium]MCB9984583.1 flagellar motor protein MotB [Micavibrio sp.]